MGHEITLPPELLGLEDTFNKRTLVQPYPPLVWVFGCVRTVKAQSLHRSSEATLAGVACRVFKRNRWLRYDLSQSSIVVNIPAFGLYPLNEEGRFNFARFLPNNEVSNIGQTRMATLGSFIDVKYCKHILQAS